MLPPPLSWILILTFILLDPGPSLTQAKKVINYNPVEIGRTEAIDYFTSVLLHKSSTLDRSNEDIFYRDTFSEDLYHQVDNLMPRPHFIKHLLLTKNITDKVDSNGGSLLSSYGSDLNMMCSPDSVWDRSISDILKILEGDFGRSSILNDLKDYQKKNVKTSEKLICNRFKGLKCHYKISSVPEKDQGRLQEYSDNPTCQCSGDPENVGFYKRADRKKEYPDGCYIRPWRPCHHLSFDPTFPQSYPEWHTNLRSQRGQLALMVFPVSRPHRCREGTYCLDLIQGMKTPVCWCTKDSKDPKCLANEREKDDEKRVPAIDPEFNRIRKDLLKMLIKPEDSKSTCYPELNQKVSKLAHITGMDPTKTGVFQLMKDLVTFAEEKNKASQTVRICDFRQGLICDNLDSKCRGIEMCGPGKINLGKGVCAANNGDPCETSEECVPNAKCETVKGTTDSVCQCENGYGDRCLLQDVPFFSKLFVPITSGFSGDDFIKQQVVISSILETWEDSMNLIAEQTCDPVSDAGSMNIVNYFGDLTGPYDPVRGQQLLTVSKQVIEDGSKLCMYNRFLRCHERLRKCVPIQGSRILELEGPHAGDLDLIHVEVEADGLCDPKQLPLIFQDIVALQCVKGFKCGLEKDDGNCIPDCESEFAPLEECQNAGAVMEDEIGREELSGRGLEGRFFQSLTNTTNSTGPGVNCTTGVNCTGPVVNGTGPGMNCTVGVNCTGPIVNGTGPGMNCTVGVNCTGPVVNGTGPGMNCTTGVNCTGPGMNCTTGVNCTNPIVNGTNPGNTTMNATTTVEPITVAPPPLRKALIEEPCEYNDDRSGSLDDDEIRLTCDSEYYLVCKDGRCECHGTLIYVKQELQCLIPLGSRCDEEHVDLPKNTLMNYEALHCQNGACIKDGERSICRPETDVNLIVVSFKSE